MLTDDLGASIRVPEDRGWGVALAFWTDAAVRLNVRDAVPLLRERMVPHHDCVVNTAITVVPGVAYYFGHYLSRTHRRQGRGCSPIGREATTPNEHALSIAPIAE